MYADLVIQICNIQLSISQKIPTIPPIQPSPLVCCGKMAISVCSIILHCQKYHFFVLNRVRVLKTSAAHSLYPNSPLVHLQYKKQNYITPGDCSEGVTGKRRASLKTFTLKNGHCHFWRQLLKRVSNHKALTGKSVVVLIDKCSLIIGRWSLMRHCRMWRFNCNH